MPNHGALFEGWLCVVSTSGVGRLWAGAVDIINLTFNKYFFETHCIFIPKYITKSFLSSGVLFAD